MKGITYMGNLRSLLKLTPFLQKYKLLLFFVLISILSSSIIAIPIPYIMGRITDDVLIGSKSFKRFYFYIGIIAILYILKYLISVISNYLSSKFNNFVSNELRFVLIDKIMNLPMDYLGNVEKGYLQGRISECSSIASNLSTNIVGTLVNMFDAILSISTMFAINYKLATTVFILIPFFFIVV